jgi:hypothetical protein
MRDLLFQSHNVPYWDGELVGDLFFLVSFYCLYSLFCLFVVLSAVSFLPLFLFPSLLLSLLSASGGLRRGPSGFSLLPSHSTFDPRDRVGCGGGEGVGGTTNCGSLAVSVRLSLCWSLLSPSPSPFSLSFSVLSSWCIDQKPHLRLMHVVLP